MCGRTTFPFTTSQLSSFNFHLLASAVPSLCHRYTSASSPIKNYRIIGGRAEDHRRNIGAVLANNSSKKPFAGKFRRTDVTLGIVGTYLFTDISRLAGLWEHFSEKSRKKILSLFACLTENIYLCNRLTILL